MSEILKKPYEISVWEDRLVTTEDDSYLEEVKLAVIGTDKMTAPNRVYSPILNSKNNGEQTLTFSLKSRYYDELVGDFVVNPFASYLFNERKIKLYYNDKWSEFIIKDYHESQEEYEYVYTAVDAFVNELSKTGYGLTFNIDLNNNQGTAVELGKKVVEGTDWIIDEENSDTLRQTIDEAVYEAVVIKVGGLEAKNLDTGENENIPYGTPVYIFYSYIQSEKGQFLQFIKRDTSENPKYIVDDNNVIIATNYQVIGDYFFEEHEQILVNNEPCFDDIALDLTYKAYRLVYDSLTTYDPIMGRTVQRYQINYSNETEEVYHYTSTDYTTSDMVTNIVTNGNNFTSYGSGIPTGWSAPANENSKLYLDTYPSLKKKDSFAKLSEMNNLTGYLVFEAIGMEPNVTFKWKNAAFNSGIMDNASVINGISKGEDYLLRIRYKIWDENTQKLRIPTNSDDELVAFIGKYSIDGDIRHVTNESDYYFTFYNQITNKETNNIVSGGELNSEKTLYLIDKVIQTPSFLNVYEVVEDNQTKQYVWNGTNYILKSESTDFADYKIYKGTARQPVPNSVLTNVNERIGIFLYARGDKTTTFYIEDIQITKYIEDANEKIVFIGDAPTAEIKTRDNFYLKPTTELSADEINTYTSLESLADDLAITTNDIILLRNDKCEKILSISEEKSNCFNILQTICETFECWLKIEVEHDEFGYITKDENGHLIKKIAFKEYVGKDNFAGFKYGINLNSIERTINTEEIVTKLIVGEPANDYTNTGTLSISQAAANPSGESYILNFDYYLSHGLIQNQEAFNQELAKFNYDLKQLNQQYQAKNNELIEASRAFENLQSKLRVISSAYESAVDNYKKALTNFESVTNQSYEDFIESGQEVDASIESEIDDIYSYAIEKNNYGGILPNVKKEYEEINLKYNGAQKYSITVTTNTSSPQTKLVISDYIEGFEFFFLDRDSTTYPYNSGINKKQFVVDNINCINLVITQIPAHYKIQYTTNNKTQLIELDSSQQFNIYDIVNEKGKTIRLQLVPDDEFASQYVGLKQELQNILDQKKEIKNKFFTKYSYYIQEGTWESNDYIEPELYYIDALQVSKTSAQPKVEYVINVTEISEIEGFENYTFDVGDKTYIEDTEFFGWHIEEEVINRNENDPQHYQLQDRVIIKTPVKEEVIISEVEWHLDEPEQNIITIQNYKTQFEDLFQRINATVQTVQYNQASYARAASILDEFGNINASLLVSSLNGIASIPYDMTGGGAIKTSSEGIIIRNLTSPSNLLIINSRGINYSVDGGITKTLLVSPDGINTEELTSGKINTQSITIGSKDVPSFRWDANGISAYEQNENGFDLNSFVRFDRYGVYGVKNGTELIESIDDVKEEADFGLTWDGFFIKNKYRNGYVSISSTDDIQVVENGIEKIKIGHFNDTNEYGIRIKNSDGQTVFETDDEGNISVTGTIQAAEGQIGGFTIGENSLYNGDFGEPDSIYLSTGYESEHPIAGFKAKNTWTIAIGDNFGVDKNGTLYATAAQIRGTIYAENGEFTGHVNATSGNFTGNIMVGRLYDKYITIDATKKDPIIASSDYVHNTSAGWMINGEGNAIFNNVSVRGAIKTAVFEYSEIEAVGGAFLFRPSSTIKEARIEGNDLIITAEKTLIFSQNEWVKVSNINDEDRVDDNLTDGGLTHVYRIKNDPKTDKYIVLDGAAADFSSVEPWEDIDVAKSVDGTVEEIYNESAETLDNTYEYEFDGNIYRTELDMVLLEDKTYYFNYNYRRYVKNSYRANWIEYIYPDDEGGSDEDEETTNATIGEIITKERDVIYVGNLALINPNAESTVETFLITTETVDGNVVTTIYSSDPEPFFFKVYLVEDNTIKTNIADLEGGALISFGYYDIAYRPFNIESDANPYQYHLYELINGEYVLTSDTEVIEGKTYYKEQYENGNNNYGIGINSSDNYVNLPKRAISLFETKIKPNESVKVEYDYKGILGTLPNLDIDLVSDSIYNNNMAGTQGIFTNNMYIGDNSHYIAFYTDSNNNTKKLRIAGADIVFTYSDGQGGVSEQTLDEKIDEIEAGAGEDAIHVEIDSSAGNIFINGVISTILRCYVYKGGIDITHDNNYIKTYTWKKINVYDGSEVQGWTPTTVALEPNAIRIATADVDSKAVFQCMVEIEEA